MSLVPVTCCLLLFALPAARIRFNVHAILCTTEKRTPMAAYGKSQRPAPLPRSSNHRTFFGSTAIDTSIACLRFSAGLNIATTIYIHQTHYLRARKCSTLGDNNPSHPTRFWRMASCASSCAQAFRHHKLASHRPRGCRSARNTAVSPYPTPRNALSGRIRSDGHASRRLPCTSATAIIVATINRKNTAGGKPKRAHFSYRGAAVAVAVAI